MSKALYLSKQYREFRERCGVKDPVKLGEIEEAYFEGYHEAEKDLELTWEDVVLFRTLFDATDANIRSGSIKIQPMTKEYYQEVLERYNKERKEL